MSERAVKCGKGDGVVETVQLEIFNSIATTNNYTKTAEIFNISQPAVTQNIQRLENQLGIKLVTRNSRGIALTEAGQEFLPYTEKILETLNEAQTRMKNFARGQSGRIKIASVPSISRYISECLMDFSENYANVQIDVDIFEGEEFVKVLNRDIYDFFFAPAELVDNDVLFEHINIGSDYLSLFANKDNAQRIKRDIDENGWKVLEKYPFISVDMTNHQLRVPTNRVFQHLGINPKITNFYNRSDSVLLSVGSGIGIAMLPHEFVNLYHRSDIVEIPCEFSSNKLCYAFAWKTDVPVGAKALFKESVIKKYSEK